MSKTSQTAKEINKRLKPFVDAVANAGVTAEQALKNLSVLRRRSGKSKDQS